MVGWNRIDRGFDDPDGIDEYLREEYRAERGAYAERRPAYARYGEPDADHRFWSPRLPVDYVFVDDGRPGMAIDREPLYRAERGPDRMRGGGRPPWQAPQDQERRSHLEDARPRDEDRHEGGRGGTRLYRAAEHFYENLAHNLGADPEGRRHRGRGPRGYRRSDERILDDVHDRLTDDPHVDASDIEVTVRDQEVTLSGMVGDRFQKRHAEDIVESVSGVTHVQNNLRVRMALGS